MPYDDDRRELFDLLEGPLGARAASLLMANLPPVGWADLATKADLAALRSELSGDMAHVRGEMAELRGEMAELRGEMKGLVPKLWAANVATMLGLSGLVFAVASSVP